MGVRQDVMRNMILDEFVSSAQLCTELRRFMTVRGIPRHFKRVIAKRSHSEGLIQIADLMTGAMPNRMSMWCGSSSGCWSSGDSDPPR
jgi:hypothetical protein